ncbi:MAG: ABC transporter permease subunit [Candidatus Dojkabacteria bacterium]|jgi:ABC-2 type transport system permease protein|nr:ABC transporter permease subunit [Candidatus Dojkabacteria bacterium]
MKNVINITIKEVRDYFISPIAYVVIAAFVVVIGILFMKDFFVDNQADIRPFFEIVPGLLIIVIPAITMRSWAEEKREGTLEIISTLPVSRLELILSKFISCLLFVTFLILLTFPIPLTLNLMGSPDNGVILAGYIGLILLSASYITIGQFISINTQNQIVAFILSAIIIAVLYLFGEPQFLQVMPISLRSVFEALGLGSHFRSVARGVIDSRDVLYYLSIIGILFYFINKSFERIRRKGS